MKTVYLANFNLTFGDKNEPLLFWLDQYVLPALNSGIRRKISKETKIIFKDVRIINTEYGLALCGFIIKDTILDVYSKYNENYDFLSDEEEHHPSAPYSVFLIYLKNHRMALVKNQKGSPDLRLFASSIEDILRKYKNKENKEIKKSLDNGKKDLLPYAVVDIKGIKSEENIEKALKDVKKIKRFVIKTLPRNNEWIGLGDMVEQFDDELRKISNSKSVNIVIGTPQSKNGVISIIKELNGVAKTELQVEYNENGVIDDDGKTQKRRGKISDSDMTQVLEVNLSGNLKNESAITTLCAGIPELHVETNNIIDYNNYVNNRKQR